MAEHLDNNDSGLHFMGVPYAQKALALARKDPDLPDDTTKRR